MTRDELILAFQPVVDSVVRKYNNHESDEDLQSVGMIKCVKAVDKCLSENENDFETIKPRVIVWARNAILNEIRTRRNIGLTDNIDDYELSDESDYAFLVADVRASLNGKALEIFEMLNDGYTDKEICEKLHICSKTYYNYVNVIKNVITKN